MNLINSTSCGITCSLSLFPSRNSESRMRKLKLTCGLKWQIWRGFARHWQCYPVSAALQSWNNRFCYQTVSSFSVSYWGKVKCSNVPFGALPLCVISHKVSSPSVFFYDWILFYGDHFTIEGRQKATFWKSELGVLLTSWRSRKYLAPTESPCSKFCDCLRRGYKLRVTFSKNQRNRGHRSKFNFAHTLSIGRPRSHTY